MASKKQQKKLQVGTFGEAEDVPRAGLPDSEHTNRRARRYRRLVWTTVILMPLTLLALLVMVSQPQPEDTGTMAASSPGRAVATDTMRTWLAGDPPPVVGGVLISWDGATDLGIDKKQDGAQSVQRSLEIDHFTISDKDGNLYDSDVEVAIDVRGGAEVLSGPSLIPRPPVVNDGWSSGSIWPGLATTNASPAVTQAVNAWLGAYTSGDPDALRLAVGDPDESNNYVPLTGATVMSSEITDAASIGKSGGSIVVRIQMTVSWAPTADTTDTGDDNGDDNDSTTTTTTTIDTSQIVYPQITLDLLVERANTASPVVTAWGGVGTGPTLVRYGNAVTGTRSTTDQSADTSTTITPQTIVPTRPQPKPKKKTAPATTKPPAATAPATTPAPAGK